MWIFPKEMSRIACKICLEKDDPFIRDLITKSADAYYYCRVIEDRPEIRDRITESEYAYWYCKDVKDRSKIRARITKSQWAYRYCKFIKDRPEIRERITCKKLLMELLNVDLSKRNV